MRIGVFDSGIGGKAIAKTLYKNLNKDIEIIIVDDHKNLPYGNKTPNEVINLTDTAIQPLLNSNCQIIIIACNTATALAIDTLRLKYPNQKFIGIEPMIKTASILTKSKIIAVCATPATLNSDKYKRLVMNFGSKLEIIQPDCSNWAKMIEDNQINHHQIEKIIDDICKKGGDIIVLGCTHYHWIKKLIDDICKGRAEVIEPSDAVVHRVKELLKSC